jgi:hypothetical protein
MSERHDPVSTIKFIVQRVSKVPQPVGKKAALVGELPAISTLSGGTIIAEQRTRSFGPLIFEARLIEQARLPFNVGGSVLTKLP